MVTQGYATVSRKREAKFVGGVRTENPEEDEIGVRSRVTYSTCMSIGRDRGEIGVRWGRDRSEIGMSSE